ncbi:toll/interleukin-1 receptor domain-containing protein [Streptomyces sp. MP131-18]|uniref:toll/interleukin-1 receptor domain-containing protein n=1 Tax=Streptomyces sp. MP131-18 TaxID=1857892 RepID=UPI00097C141E|nr:toll/interleukin-1 receptor domain-containing protein [Streptomyces sp. MP131-18]ONK10445.1 hypothetical protein STBA_11670 [Streptomyces sp. MP131-18]
MARPRIFVSHSSRACADASCGCSGYLEAALRLVEEAGCTPVSDRDVLAAGDAWHGVLMRELGSCQGAVVLISPHALGSHWVLEEAIVAAYLWEVTDGAFPVLPVPLPGVRRHQLRGSKLEKVGLDRFDMPDWGTEDDPKAPPHRLRETLVRLAQRHGSLPYPRVTELIADRVGVLSPVVLTDVAELLGVTVLPQAPAHMGYVVSAGLLSERPVAALGAHCAMRKALGRFLHLLTQEEHRQEVVDVVVPFARVPGLAAEQLNGLRGAGGGRTALLRARWPGTADMYVRRASEHPRPWPLHKPVPRPGGGFVDGLVEEIHAFLVRELCYGMPCGAEDLRRILARQEEECGPVTIVLNAEPDQELVRRLTAAFPQLLFLFTTGGAPDGRAGPWMLLASLPPEQELDMVLTHRDFTPVPPAPSAGHGREPGRGGGVAFGT